MDLGLKERRALVTAASRGLGRACAEALIAEGARVFISSSDAARIEATAAEIGAHGWRAADVSSQTDIEELVERAVEKLGGLDILIVNAGGPPPGTFQTTPVESWEPAFRLTLMSAVRLVSGALPQLKQSGQGRILFITSISVRQPLPNIALSNALRAAVTGLAKTISRELAPDRITVNCVAPDAILTDRIRKLASAAGEDVDQQLERNAKSLPMKRYGDPAEFAAACAFLCSKQAAYISGQTLGIDGASLVGVH
ncbi:MAG TPA: SDR family oxidoreductase [Candidatus Dormibacteraeota bacterium]|nr:SDR family oxidoreductase [Candidatus Dormibacteraeota bacterium]